MKRVPSLAPAALALLAVLTLAPRPAASQAVSDHEDFWASDGLGEVAFLGLNAAVGALTSGLWQELSGGSFEEGFTGGALGGSVAYAGKRLAAESFTGAGFLGRGVAAAGSSMVRNAADARPLLDSLMVPVGPLRLYLRPRKPTAPRLEANLRDLYWTAYGLAESRLELDVGESLSSGMPVFQADRDLIGSDDSAISGATTGGVVYLSPLGEGGRTRSLAHERAHVLQFDFVYHAWLRPLEDHLARQLPMDGFVDRIDYDVVLTAVRSGANALDLGDPFDAPIEAEAEFLEER
jgi:hypothetical protein